MTSAARILTDRAGDVRATFRGAYRFRGELLKHRGTLAGAFLFALAFAVVRLAEPWPLKFIFDNVLADMPLDTPIEWIDEQLGGDRTAILVAATVAILVLAFLRGLTADYQKVMTSVVGQRVVRSRATAARIREEFVAELEGRSRPVPAAWHAPARL